MFEFGTDKKEVFVDWIQVILLRPSHGKVRLHLIHCMKIEVNHYFT